MAERMGLGIDLGTANLLVYLEKKGWKYQEYQSLSKKCDSCPNRITNKNNFVCSLSNYIIPDINITPTWCQLNK